MNNDNYVINENNSAEIKHLQEKLENLTSEFTTIKEGKLDVKEDIQTLHLDIQQMNRNFEVLITKLDNLNFESDMKIHHEETIPTPKKRFSLKKAITSPIRKLTVNTLSSIFAITDRSTETVTNIKENFVDIAAEAKYKSHKKDVNLAEQI